MLLKLMFYQYTYIAAISFKECVVYLGDSQVVMSLPHFQFNSKDFAINHILFCASLQACSVIFRHQSTSRLTFKFCCVISAAQGEVKIKPSLKGLTYIWALSTSRLPKWLGEDIQASQPASPPDICILLLSN